MFGLQDYRSSLGTAGRTRRFSLAFKVRVHETVRF